MVDPSETGSESEGTNRKNPDVDSSIESSNEHGKKTCTDCGTTKTPLWRGGPSGPKSLCNACGIRNRKRRRSILGTKGQTDEKKARKGSNNGLKQRLWGLGRDVMMQRLTVEKQRRKLGEEEQAAVLLMALSCGSVYA